MERGWSDNRKLWETLSTEVSRYDWRSVPLVELEINSVPDVSGVYMMCGGTPVHISKLLGGRVFGPLYVGRANDLRRRFLQHCRRPDSNIDAIRHCWQSRLQFWFAAIPLDHTRIVEGLLIDCFGPRANRRREIRATLGPPLPA
jgi:hypothetical protein